MSQDCYTCGGRAAARRAAAAAAGQGGCDPVAWEVRVAGVVLRYLSAQEARAAGRGREPTPVCR